MNSVNDAGNIKMWLTEFLLSRLMTSKSLFQPLYRYEVTDDEYHSLVSTLKLTKDFIHNSLIMLQWAPCFCLFVAEAYRREYDGGEGGWSWHPYENLLGVDLSQEERSQIVRNGLKYWGRPLRSRENGADYLGSLFAEGGLPWRLLSAEKHGFGRAVKSGIKNYYAAKRSGIPLTLHVKDFGKYFPANFRNHETYVLLASVVESLMTLAKLYEDLQSQDDPALYLDKQQPNWRTCFPLPIGETNAKTLVNEWLKNAGAKQKEIEEVKGLARNYTSINNLVSTPEKLCFESKVFLPLNEQVILESAIQSTRLEMVFFEGEKRILNAGIIYGHLDDSRTSLKIQFPQNEYKLNRKDIEKPLMLQLFSNGAIVAVYYFQNSDFSLEDLPLIFSDADEPELIACASTDLSLKSVLVRCPSHAKTQPELEPCTEDVKGGKWYRIYAKTIFNINNSSFYVQFKEFVEPELPVIKGRLCLFDTVPNLTYYGVPSVDLAVSELARTGLPSVYIDELPVPPETLYGSHILSLKNTEGLSFFRKKVGLLPDDLIIHTASSYGTAPAQVQLKTQQNISVSISNETVIVLSQESNLSGINIKLALKNNAEIPSNLHLNLKSADSDSTPVLIRLPYPHEGATLFDSAGKVIDKNIISLNQLLGMSLQLTSTSGHKQRFYMVAELRGMRVSNLRRSYQFDVFNQTINVSLYAFHDDFMQLLSTVTDQDALIKVRIETDQLIKQFEIRRYAGHIEQMNQTGCFSLVADVSLGEGQTSPIGIHLADPAEIPITIPQKMSAGISTDYFEIPQTMKIKGPWLIAPSETSSLLFRPSIWITDDMSDREIEKVQAQTMHKAAALYHPTLNSEAFNYVITEMASDMSHSGWVYLSKLKEKYTYMPLSVFMAWHSLSSKPQALASAVFRLDVDYLFCQRLVNDLAIIWETITLEQWKHSVANFREYLISLGIAEIAVDGILTDKFRSVGNVIPAIKYFSEYLLTSSQEKVHAVPIAATFPHWYQELRRRHCDDDRWPEFMGEELKTWMIAQADSQQFHNEINMDYERSVVFFPIFMAYLTSGRSIIEDLEYDIAETRFALRVLSDFDREAWYEPVYALVLSNLIKKENSL